MAVTCARVMISTELSRTACTVRSWARKASRRCTSATERATGSRWSAQSKALSPPPTITTSLSTYGWNDGTKNSSPATEPAVPGGERAGAELADAGGDDDGPRVDLGAVVEADRDRVPVVLEGLRGAVEVVDGARGRGLRHQSLHQLLPLTVGKPATSRIAFSGYIAVTWPPSSGRLSTMATRNPRNPA